MLLQRYMLFRHPWSKGSSLPFSTQYHLKTRSCASPSLFNRMSGYTRHHLLFIKTCTDGLKAMCRLCGKKNMFFFQQEKVLTFFIFSTFFIFLHEKHYQRSQRLLTVAHLKPSFTFYLLMFIVISSFCYLFICFSFDLLICVSFYFLISQKFQQTDTLKRC